MLFVGKDKRPSLKSKGNLWRARGSNHHWVGKLQLHINNYFDNKDFYVSLLQIQDVILGASWFHRVYAQSKFIVCDGREFLKMTNKMGITILALAFVYFWFYQETNRIVHFYIHNLCQRISFFQWFFSSLNSKYICDV